MLGGKVRGGALSGVWERRRSRRDGANSSNCCIGILNSSCVHIFFAHQLTFGRLA